MLLAASDKSAAKIGREMCIKIVEWGQGRVSDSWLESELVDHPVHRDFRVPGSAQLRRMASRTKDSIVASSVLSILAFAAVRSGKALFSSN